jgi:hypothetical protein
MGRAELAGEVTHTEVGSVRADLLGRDLHKWQSYTDATDVKDAKQSLCATMVPRGVL